MKNINRFFFATALVLISLTSCTKTMDVVAPAPVNNSTSATTISEVSVSENFDWSTTKKVNFTFDGQSSEEYSLLLQVTDADGNVLFQKMQKSNDRYLVTLNVPANLSALNVKYGADLTTIDCSSGTATIRQN